MNVRWEDGRLAAKQLFEALDYCKIPKEACEFINLYETLEEQGRDKGDMKIYIKQVQDSRTVVAMGRTVENGLKKLGIEDYKYIIHPAARGTIRKKENYFNHVRKQLL